MRSKVIAQRMKVCFLKPLMEATVGKARMIFKLEIEQRLFLQVKMKHGTKYGLIYITVPMEE